jgi:ATP-binding cassette subfamily C exporter for protease/lipase
MWVALFSLIANLLTLAPTIYMLQVFDRVMYSQSEVTLIAITLFLVVFVALMAFAEWVRARLLVRAGIKFDEMLNAKIFRAAFSVKAASEGNQSTKAFADLTYLRQFLTGNGVFALFDMPWIGVYLAVLFVMHPLLGWVSIAFALLLIAVALLSSFLSKALHEKVVESESAANLFIASKLRNAETVEALGMLPNLKQLWTGLYRIQVKHRVRAHDRSHQVQALSKFVQYSQQSLILALGAWLAVKGEITLGSMIAANTLMGSALRPVGSLLGTWKQFTESRHAHKRLTGVLQAEPAGENFHAAQSLQGHIKLENLVASASHRTAPILNQVSLEFAPGEVVGVVGASGAGKSTLLKCLMGIWPKTEGRVLIDACAIEDWQRDSLGQHIGYLPQDPELMDGSVAENISRFREVDSHKVIEAAKRVGVHELILRLPNGYDTQLGQAAHLLSGGQRQRLALARAVYDSPQLVFLDEPNANLDDIGEAALAKVIAELKASGKSVFMVLHQKNLLALADKIVVIENGRLRMMGRTSTLGV